MTDTPSAAPGWYPDPEDASQQRYWDGAQWTDQRQPASPAGDAFGQPPQPASAAFGQPAPSYPAQTSIYIAPQGPAQVVSTGVGAENAVIALVCGIFGLLCCGPVGIVALVMGQSARNKAVATGQPMNGTMKAAWIVGIVAVVLWGIGILVYIAIVLAAAGSSA